MQGTLLQYSFQHPQFLLPQYDLLLTQQETAQQVQLGLPYNFLFPDNDYYGELNLLIITRTTNCISVEHGD